MAFLKGDTKGDDREITEAVLGLRKRLISEFTAAYIATRSAFKPGRSHPDSRSRAMSEKRPFFKQTEMPALNICGGVEVH